jgi:ATP-binding cassette, subfamily B, bacterial MsbA
MAKLITSDTRPLIARLWREWVRPHRNTIILVLIVIAIAAAANALYPLMVKGAFDLLEKKDFNTLKWSPLIVIAVTSTKGLALWAQQILTNKFVTRIEADMQIALYNHMVDSDVSQLGRESTASLTQRFTTDFAFIKEALTRLFTVFFRDIAMLITLVAVLLYIDFWSTVIAAVVTPFILPPFISIGKKLRRLSTSMQEQTGTMATNVSESLAGTRVAKAYQLEGYLKGRAANAFNDIRSLKMKGANVRAKMDPILEIGAGFAIALVIIFVGWRLQSGGTTLGDFAAYSGALIMATQPVRTLGNLNAVMQEALAALARYYALMDEKPLIIDQPHADDLKLNKGTVQLQNIGYTYADKTEALSDASFTADGGKMTALVGRSGSGKSTLLSLIPRLIDADRGQILIDGQNIRDVKLQSLRDQVAVVSQDITLFDDTIRANIAFGKKDASDLEIIEAAKMAAAHDFILAQPEGYQTSVGERGTKLSGGERQRIALARAFLKNAPILLLDEATSALDAESEELVQQALERLMKGRTTLVIAHRLSTIRNADNIIVLDQGKVAEQGKHAALLKTSGIYAGLHKRQFRDD